MAKSPEERGDFSAWAYRVRVEILDLDPDWVAAQLHYSAPSIRKLDAGGPTYRVSKRLRRGAIELYTKIAQEQRKTLPPIPAEPGREPASGEGLADLTAAIRENTAVMAALLARLGPIAEDATAAGAHQALAEAAARGAGGKRGGTQP